MDPFRTYRERLLVADHGGRAAVRRLGADKGSGKIERSIILFFGKY